MKLIIGTILSLFILAAPVHASASEATKLQGVVTAVGAIGSDLGNGIITDAQAGAKLASLRDMMIGDISAYSDGCKPVAYFLWQMTDNLSQALILMATDVPTAQGFLMVGVAELDFTSNSTFQQPMAVCAASV